VDQIVPHYESLKQRTVSEIMTSDVVLVKRDTPLTRVLHLMVNLKPRSFPVVNHERRLEGMISRTDVIRALKDATCDERI